MIGTICQSARIMHENWMFPSSFVQSVLLSAKNRDGASITFLYDAISGDMTPVRLALKDKAYGDDEGDCCIFLCDIVELKHKPNGSEKTSKRFLSVYDVLSISGQQLKNVPFGVRFELARSLFRDPRYYDRGGENDYRVMSPPLFHVSEIVEVNKFLIPDYCGQTIGFKLFHDVFVPDVERVRDAFMLRVRACGT